MRQMILAACAAPFLLISALPSYAEPATAGGDFTFKRIGVPKDGAGKRITVQIKPGDALPPPKKKPMAEEPGATPPAAASPGRLAWFWETVSPELTAAGPGRLEPALRRIGAPPAGQGVPTPRLGQLMDIARAHQSEILLRTAGTRVSPALVLAVIAVESAGRVDAVSGAGAEGLMQLMPATAARFGVDDSKNAAQNIKGGVAFLDLLMAKFGGDPILVLAGYNAGENSIGKHNGVPPYAETRDYVPKVLAAFEVARSLCRTRPELISDGCVFSFPS
ncbi:lytic murein transglycosylase [Oceanicola sp. 22II-s10i]|uniref:lytic transglycosylase domain-containing protein n=1 Tax=Oceanicola sp. 22II-s10i TaxID=1317116 RepID=UPI000B525D9A|nr:lytic transglycosylase domain-containing protein [Oceanicola sp. 22II-s10i]OWU86426.1 lytic murein transglycosylase [Oceanicola sp. 22II-s10i]